MNFIHCTEHVFLYWRLLKAAGLKSSGRPFMYMKGGDLREGGQVLGVTAPAVQQHCDKAGWNVVRVAEKELARLISLSLKI